MDESLLNFHRTIILESVRDGAAGRGQPSYIYAIYRERIKNKGLIPLPYSGFIKILNELVEEGQVIKEQLGIKLVKYKIPKNK